MAIQEGRCPNCGSIVHLDSAAEKGHCLFCDAVFDNQEALRIAASPAGVVFPNLPQPKYEGPSLNPVKAQNVQAVQRKQQQQPAAKKPVEVKSAYVMKEPVKVPSFKLPGKTKLLILAVIVAILVIVSAIAVPVILNRDSVRTQLLSSISSFSPFAVDVDTHVTISNTENSYLLIIAGEDVTATDAVTLFKAYCQKRAAILGMSSSDPAIYKQVKLKLIMPAGGWLIDHPSSESVLDDRSAVTSLAP